MTGNRARAGQTNNRSAMIAKVHVAKKILALEEGSYRALLTRVTSKDSCGLMDEGELHKVLAEFRRFMPPKKPIFPGGKCISPSTKPYVRKVYALWWSLESKRTFPSREKRRQLHNFVRRQTGIDNPEWLNPSAANKVIEGIKAMKNREEAGGD